MTYIKAKERCEELGSSLVEILSENEWKKVIQQAQHSLEELKAISLYQINAWVRHANYNWTGYWVGLTDKAREGTFVWDSGHELLINHWADGQPSNSGGGEDCAFYYMDSLSDVGCNASWVKKEVVCQKGIIG